MSAHDERRRKVLEEHRRKILAKHPIRGVLMKCTKSKLDRRNLIIDNPEFLENTTHDPVPVMIRFSNGKVPEDLAAEYDFRHTFNGLHSVQLPRALFESLKGRRDVQKIIV